MELLANPQLQQLGGYALQGAKELYGVYKGERAERKKLERETEKLKLQAQLAQERELQKAQLQQQRDLLLREGQVKYQKEIQDINLATLKKLKQQGYSPEQIENFISLTGGGRKIYSPKEDVIKEYRPVQREAGMVNPKVKGGRLRKVTYRKPKPPRKIRRK